MENNGVIVQMHAIQTQTQTKNKALEENRCREDFNWIYYTRTY